MASSENTISATKSEGYSLGFRCLSRDKYNLMFFTPEVQDLDHRPKDFLAGLNHYMKQLKIRIDDGVVIGLTAAEEWDNDSKLFYRVYPSPEVISVVSAMRGAARRIVVGAEPNYSHGQNHVVEFGVTGAREALTKSMKACGIDSNAGN